MFGLGNKKKINKNYCIIIGCGRLGATLANDFSLKGKEVVMIDIDKAAFRKLPEEYSGFSIESDGADIDVLENSDIAKANYLFAVTNNDNINITIAHIAKKIYNVPNTVARIYDTEKKSIMDDCDIVTIYPTSLSIKKIEDILFMGEKK